MTSQAHLVDLPTIEESTQRLRDSIAWLRDGKPYTRGIGVGDMIVLEAALADRAAGRALEAVPEKEWYRDCITLTALQLRHALDFAAPDFDVGEEQRETQVSIAWAPAGATYTDEGDPDPAGYKVWLTDYPEEGSIPLDESLAGFPVKSAERGRVIAALAAKALASPAAAQGVDQPQMPPEFLDYVRRNYSGEVVFHDPLWHAVRLWRAAMHASKKPAVAEDRGIAMPGGYKLSQGTAHGQRYVLIATPSGRVIVNAYELGSPEMFEFLSAFATTAQPAAPTEHPDTKRLDWLLPNLHPANFGMGFEWGTDEEFLAGWRNAIDADLAAPTETGGKS